MKKPCDVRVQNAFAKAGPIHRNGLKGQVQTGPNCAAAGITLKVNVVKAR